MCAMLDDPAALADVHRFAQCRAGGKVIAIQAMTGAAGASRLFRVDLHAPWQGNGSFVVRRYHDARWLQREPDLPDRESAMLALASHAGLPAPRFLGRRGGDVPLVAMSRLDGAPLPDRAVGPAHLEAAAAIVARIHAVRPPAAEAAQLPRYAPHYITGTKPIRAPAWSRAPELWSQAIELYFRWPGTESTALVHRDFHLANLLFRGDRVVGVVDWVTACLGNPLADIGHMRWNLVRDHGFDAAEVFARAYRAQTGVIAHGLWLLYALVGALPDLPPPTPQAAGRLDRLLAEALAFSPDDGTSLP